MPERTVQGLVADAAAGGTISLASFSWLAPVTDFFQLIATLMAIVTGVYAVRWHRLRIKIAKEKMNVKSD